MTKSLKTSTASIAGLITLLAATVKQMTDGDPTTNPDWSVVVPLFISAIGGLFARDNDKTSEDVGAK